MVAERVRSAKETAKRPVDGEWSFQKKIMLRCQVAVIILLVTLGFVLEGFDTSSPECMRDMLISANQCLPECKPRFIHGLHTPGQSHPILILPLFLN